MMIIMTVQTVPWLLLRGCLAALTPRGAPDADILIQSLALAIHGGAVAGRRASNEKCS